jgi:hypothetical protein
MLFKPQNESAAGQIKTLMSFIANCWRHIHQRVDEEPTALGRNKANGENIDHVDL